MILGPFEKIIFWGPDPLVETLANMLCIKAM